MQLPAALTILNVRRCSLREKTLEVCTGLRNRLYHMSDPITSKTPRSATKVSGKKAHALRYYT